MISLGIVLAVGTVLTHVHVVTEAQPAEASVLAYRDGMIVYVGNDEKAARRAAGSDARMESLVGQTIVPGFDDAHVHFGMAATIGGTRGIDVDAPDRNAWLAEVAQKIAAAPPASASDWLFIISRNLPEGLSSKDLDHLARPVFAVSSHGGLVNARGCATAGLTAAMAPNGFVRGGLMALALARTVIRLPHAELLGAARRLLGQLAQNGITSAQLISDDVAPLFEELRRAGELTARVRFVPLGHLLDREAHEARLETPPEEAPLPAPEWVRRYGVKYFHDDGAGVMSRNELAEILDEESRRGQPLVFHVLSSHALGSLLDAYERQHKKSDHPAQIRLEHLDDVSPADARRIAHLQADLGVHQSVDDSGVAPQRCIPTAHVVGRRRAPVLRLRLHRSPSSGAQLVAARGHSPGHYPRRAGQR